jgi:putative ABC transport system permease protein
MNCASGAGTRVCQEIRQRDQGRVQSVRLTRQSGNAHIIAMSLAADARYALRTLRRRPALVAVVALTLGVGIAANTVMFGIVHELLLRPPDHVMQPDMLRRVYYDAHREGWRPTHVTTYPVVGALVRDVPGAEVAAVTSVEEYTLGAGPQARHVAVQLVSGNYFAMLGVGPAIGRVIQPADDRIPDGEPVIVLGHGFWRAHFGADSGVVGRTLSLNARPFVIVGVAPQGFMGLDRRNVDV